METDTAMGTAALENNIIGSGNTAMAPGPFCWTEDNNVALGYDAQV
jgi:hypothetical protein